MLAMLQCLLISVVKSPFAITSSRCTVQNPVLSAKAKYSAAGETFRSCLCEF